MDPHDIADTNVGNHLQSKPQRCVNCNTAVTTPMSNNAHGLPICDYCRCTSLGRLIHDTDPTSLLAMGLIQALHVLEARVRGDDSPTLNKDL